MTGCRCRVAVLLFLFQFAAFHVCIAEDAEPPPRIIVMVSSVFGSPTPPQVDIQVIPNGDFEIIRNTSRDPRVKTVGNGIDEFTLWTFDFSKHPHIEAALKYTEGKPDYLLIEARLTLVVKPMATSAQTDVVYIQGSACNHTTQKLFNPPGYAELKPRTIQVIDYDLIKAGHYRPIELHNYLKLEHPTENTAQKQRGYAFTVYDKTLPGQLPMLLHDDTIISQATLMLRFEVKNSSPVGEVNVWENQKEEVGKSRVSQTRPDGNLPKPSPKESIAGKVWVSPDLGNSVITCLVLFLEPFWNRFSINVPTLSPGAYRSASQDSE